MLSPSFKQIRLPVPPPAFGGTGAAGSSRFAFANDNARLRLFPEVPHRVLRLAGRVALAQLRAVVHSSRTITTAFRSNCFNMVKRIPCAVFEIRSAYPLPVGVGHHRLLAPEVSFTTGAFAGVGQPFSELGKGADHGRCH